MPVVHASFSLQPEGFFNSNPTTYLAAHTQGRPATASTGDQAAAEAALSSSAPSHESSAAGASSSSSCSSSSCPSGSCGSGKKKEKGGLTTVPCACCASSANGVCACGSQCTSDDSSPLGTSSTSLSSCACAAAASFSCRVSSLSPAPTSASARLSSPVCCSPARRGVVCACCPASAGLRFVPCECCKSVRSRL